MTKKMRAVLVELKRNDMRRVHTTGPGVDPWPANPCTLAALVRAELVRRDEAPRSRRGERVDRWRITDAGREALLPKRRGGDPDRDEFLAPTGSGSDFTFDPFRAIDDTPRVSKTVVDEYAAKGWVTHTLRLSSRAEGLERESLERRLARVRARGRERRVDLSSHERVIRKRIEAMERVTGDRPEMEAA